MTSFVTYDPEAIVQQSATMVGSRTTGVAASSPAAGPPDAPIGAGVSARCASRPPAASAWAIHSVDGLGLPICASRGRHYC